MVTGCGGFLGAEICRQLCARGDRVRGLARSDYPQLRDLGVELLRGDIRDADLVDRACEGMDAVVHTAALAGIWGDPAVYEAINVAGTRHVIAGCLKQRVHRLVFASSPSVTFDGRDQTGIDETCPYPSRWLNDYSRTKAKAEQLVLSADDPGTLRTCALRPHLIWGADDPHLIPRLVSRARAGRLFLVGDGRNLIDTVHVRNAAHAHLLAIDRLASPASAAAGRAYFITQNEPIECGEWIGRLLELAGLPRPTRHIPLPVAYRIGGICEWWWAWTGRPGEPPMTRFLAAQLGRAHFFDGSAAARDLGYRPLIRTAEGLVEMGKLWNSRGGPAPLASGP